MKQHDFVLIRGLAREAGHWGAFSELLQNQDFCKMIHSIDLPGTGVYHKISSPRSISENAEFVVSKIKEKKLNADTVIVSVSLGSMVAIEMIKKYPNYFYKTYVMNTSFSGLSPLHHRLQLKALKNFYRILKSSTEEQRELEVLKMVSNEKEKWPSITQEWADIAKMRPVKLQNFVNQLIAASYYRLPREKPKGSIVVLSSEQDHMVSSACSEKLAQKWDLPIFTHSTAGHELALDDPEWVVAKIQETL